MPFLFQSSFLALALLLCAILPTLAQFPDQNPPDVKVVKSRFHDGVSISYKAPGICETTPNVRSYSGYVHLPPDSEEATGQTQHYPINTFFYFFEAREDPANAPLSIWMNGGPGSSSMIGLFHENGPCHVNNDSATTYLNPYSWNNNVNMLYIDQPNQVGFSYDVPTNGTLDLIQSKFTVHEFNPDDIPRQNETFLVGTSTSQNQYRTANTTRNAAKSLWYFAQEWFEEFPDYKPNNNKISIWTESYGGKYGPAFMAYFEEQNKVIQNGMINGYHAVPLHLDTLGIMNGCVDLLVQALSYPEIAFRNTYGIEVINETLYHDAVTAFEEPGGCRDLILECRSLAAELDPEDIGNNGKVNKACMKANDFCQNYVEGPYYTGDRGYYDFAHPDKDPFPPEYYLGYLAQHDVQSALGVPINFTESIDSVFKAFASTGDYSRGGYLEDIAYVLDNGIKVALVYGDRDYACNWIGGEAVSLAVKYAYSDKFHSAGYESVTTMSGQQVGLVRQHGNFSFTRVFEAGHEVPAYQPEGSLDIFNRVLFNYDIATGRVPVTSDYSSTGSADTFYHRNSVPPYPEPTCYTLAAANTCTDDELAALVNGVATVQDYIVVGVNETDYDSSRPTTTVKKSVTRKSGLWAKIGAETKFDNLE